MLIGKTALCLALALALASTDPLYDAVERGNTLYRAGESARALEEYQRASSLGEPTAELLMNLGVSAQRLGRYDEALDYFERAAESAPGRDLADVARFNSIASAIGAGDGARAAGAPDEARADYQRAVDTARDLIRRDEKNLALRRNYEIALGRLETVPPPPEQNQSEQDQSEQDQSEQNQSGQDRSNGADEADRSDSSGSTFEPDRPTGDDGEADGKERAASSPTDSFSAEEARDILEALTGSERETRASIRKKRLNDKVARSKTPDKDW